MPSGARTNAASGSGKPVRYQKSAFGWNLKSVSLFRFRSGLVEDDRDGALRHPALEGCPPRRVLGVGDAVGLEEGKGLLLGEEEREGGEGGHGSRHSSRGEEETGKGGRRRPQSPFFPFRLQAGPMRDEVALRVDLDLRAHALQEPRHRRDLRRRVRAELERELLGQRVRVRRFGLGTRHHDKKGDAFGSLKRGLTPRLRPFWAIFRKETKGPGTLRRKSRLRRSLVARPCRSRASQVDMPVLGGNV